MTTKDPVYLIDGTAYIHRAYHAIAHLSNKKGLPTNAVFGFTNILLRVIREKKPRFLAIAFDVKGPTFRHQIFPDYKADRPPMPKDLAIQIPYVKKVVQAKGILCLEMAGVEADDLIATAARSFEKIGQPVVVVTGDKDLLQLVSDTTAFWDPMNDRTMTPQTVHDKYNVPPCKLLDLFSLIGDKVDNIPGVPGVGPKTAEKLINEYGSIENLFNNLAKISKKKLKENLTENRDQAFFSKKLIRLKEDVEIPEFLERYQIPAPDVTALREIYRELEFSKLLKSELPARDLNKEGFKLVQTNNELSRLVKLLKKANILILDTETTSLDSLTADLVGISICTGTDQAFYIPLGHRDSDSNLLENQLKTETVLNTLQPFLTAPALPKICHNLKFDYQVLETHGVRLAGILWDTIIASYLLDPSRRTHKLDDLCLEHLDRSLTSFDQVTESDKRKNCFAYVTFDNARDYACEDVLATLLLWDIFRPRLESLDLWKLFSDVEMELVPILSKMERTGVIVNPAILKKISAEFSDKISDLEGKIYHLAGGPFNINSPRQIGEILFDRLKLPHGRKTKTGYSTDVKVLKKLSACHEFPALVMTHRNLAKLKSTYTDKLSGLINQTTSRVHTSFNQTVTATGRLSSSNPNVQNIPIRTPEGQRIREAFIPAPGHLFLSADYSQIDLRVLAHYSQDKALLKAFRAGDDVHKITASEIFRMNPEFITTEMRRVAKTINFGIVYGMSAFGLAGQLNIPQKKARTFIDRYLDHYSGVKRFMDDIVRQARKDGFVTTLLNRRRPLPEIKSPNKNRREFAERTAINTPIQGTAADIIKLAMIKVDRELEKTKLHARSVLQIHDELVFETPEPEIEQTAVLVKNAMESVMDLDVPLIVNISTGNSLAAA